MSKIIKVLLKLILSIGIILSFSLIKGEDIYNKDILSKNLIFAGLLLLCFFIYSQVTKKE